MAQRGDALRDLVFVLLGLKTGLVTREALEALLPSWDCARERSLIETLIAQGTIDEASFTRLERLISQYMRERGGDVQADMPTVGADSGRQGAATLPAGYGLLPTVADDGGTLRDDGRPDERAGVRARDDGSRGPRFRTIEEHAKGGLGVVFRAIDTELNREVALKQIQAKHADNSSSRSRFLLEAEITGGLEHPGVVPVYALGYDEAGRPYYAMRFIRGESLKEAIASFHGDEGLRSDPGRRSLELRKLLRRFLDVCNTLDYAHGRGVLHRDIKPANIMVGKYGETLVVDWGIAKIGGRPEAVSEGGDRILLAKSHTGATETLPGSAMGTPAFMSPEQATGSLEDLCPASDVYSLGATLYVILTGRLAFESTDLRTVLNQVKNGDFPLPRRLDPTIPAALEAVCLKAMSRNIPDRYPSARELGDDVERWMADEPVSARPEPFPERARRWMRRRRTAVTAAAAAMLMAVVGLAVVSAVQRNANRELSLANDRVQKRFDLAMDAIRQFYTGVSEDFLLKQTEFKEQRNKLLTSARDFYTRLEESLAGLSDESSQQALGQAYYDVGDLTNRIGSGDEALLAHRKSLALRESLTDKPGASISLRADLAASLVAIARIRKGTDDADAQRLLDRAMRIRKDLVKAQPGNVRYWSDLAWNHHYLGDVYVKTKGTEPALTAYKEARAIRQRLVDEDQGVDPKLLYDLSASDNTIGVFLRRNVMKEPALPDLVKARDIRVSLLERDPSNKDYRYRLAQSYHNIAHVQATTGHLAESLNSFDKAVSLYEELVVASPAVTAFRIDKAAVTSDMARCLQRAGRFAEALPAFVKSRDIEQEVLKVRPNDTHTRLNLALSHALIGMVYAEIGRPADALVNLGLGRDLLEFLAKISPLDKNPKQQLAGTLRVTGEVLAANGRPGEAFACLERARALYEGLNVNNKGSGESRHGLSLVLAAEGAILADRRQTDEAMQRFEKARQIQQVLADASPTSTDFQSSLATLDESIARLLAGTGQPVPALRAIETAWAVRERLARDNPEDIDLLKGRADGAGVRGEVLERSDRPEDALAAYELALKQTESLAASNPSHQRLQVKYASILGRIGALHARARRPRDAAEAYRRAIGRMIGLAQLGAGDLEQLARLHARLAALEADPGSGVEPSEQRTEIDAALSALRRAVAADYRDAYHVEHGDDYRPLRELPSYPDLLSDLEFPVDPFTLPPAPFPPPTPRP